MLCVICGNEFDGRTGITYDGERVCPSCVTSHFIQCAAPACGCHVHLDDAVQSSVDGGFYCNECYEALFYCCDQCGTERRRLDIRHTQEGDYCGRCFERNYINCAECGEAVRRCNSYSGSDCEYYCSECYHEMFAQCPGCGDTHRHDDLNEDGYCENCEQNQPEWSMGRFVCDNPTFDVIGSTRRFGVELETSNCNNHRTLRGGTIWECKSDCSIEGKEFVSPILFGNEGLNEVSTFCRHARRLNWRVNRHCGYHAHFDVEGEKWDALRSIAYAYRITQELWMQLVGSERAHNSYCGRVDYDASEVREIKNAQEWEYFAARRDRFEFVNWRAYLVHGSVEIRSHEASLNDTAINSWIKIHTRFIDAVKDMSLDDLDVWFAGDTDAQMEAMRDIIGTDLWEYYIEVAANFGNAFSINTVDVNCPPF